MHTFCLQRTHSVKFWNYVAIHFWLSDLYIAVHLRLSDLYIAVHLRLSDLYIAVHLRLSDLYIAVHLRLSDLYIAVLLRLSDLYIAVLLRLSDLIFVLVFNKFSVYQLVKDSVRKTRELKIFYLVYSVSWAFKIRHKHRQSLGCEYMLRMLTICCIEIRNKKAVTTISQAPHTSTMYKYIPNMRLEEERSNYFYNCTCSFIMHIRLVIFCFSDS